ncbi:hypothetical protein F4804DRAFT_311278 [Jackrogersella minutella]|nr:hypothetical protein F4804DRAFT_311278 [Jackrogersella minutella]
MAILEAAEVPEPQAFEEGLLRCNSLVEKAKFVAAHMGLENPPGFAETQGHGTKIFMPMYDDCTIVLLHGKMKLHKDEHAWTGSNDVVRVRGCKTLTVLSDSAAVWYPAPCCWDSNYCFLATKGQCRRLGIGNVRKMREEKRSWWGKLFKRSKDPMQLELAASNEFVMDVIHK